MEVEEEWEFDIRSFYNKSQGLIPIVFPRNVFGKLRNLDEFLFLFGLQLGIRYLWVTILD